MSFGEALEPLHKNGAPQEAPQQDYDLEGIEYYEFLCIFLLCYFTRDASGSFTVTRVANRATTAMKDTIPIPMNTIVMILLSFPQRPRAGNL